MTERTNDEATDRPGQQPARTQAPGTTPAREWDREQWPGQNQPGRDQEALIEEDEATGQVPRWNAHEFVGEGQGGPDEGPTGNDPTVEGESGYSGHGHNPGGGERWGAGDKR